MAFCGFCSRVDCLELLLHTPGEIYMQIHVNEGCSLTHLAVFCNKERDVSFLLSSADLLRYFTNGNSVQKRREVECRKESIV